MMHAQAVYIYLAVLSVFTGVNNQAATSAQKLRSWPASNYFILGHSPEARIGSSIVVLNGTFYMFGGATAMGEHPHPLLRPTCSCISPLIKYLLQEHSMICGDSIPVSRRGPTSHRVGHYPRSDPGTPWLAAGASSTCLAAPRGKAQAGNQSFSQLRSSLSCDFSKQPTWVIFGASTPQCSIGRCWPLIPQQRLGQDTVTACPQWLGGCTCLEALEMQVLRDPQRCMGFVRREETCT